MSAEADGGQTIAEVAETEQATQVSYGVYKNPELIESVVVFDPIGGAQQRFLDTINVTAAGMRDITGTAPVEEGGGRFATQAQPAGPITGPGSFYLAGQTDAALSTYWKQPVCREVAAPGGQVRMDVRTATNPIQFRFDGIPLVLPRESYIEVTLTLVYYGPSFQWTFDQLHDQINGLISRGWARTASGLIQLIQAVDVSATSFQSPDMTTQNFLEAVQTKDAEIELRPDYYFNSYIAGSGGIPRSFRDKETVVFEPEEWADDEPHGLPIDSGYNAANSGNQYVGGTIRTGKKFPVTVRIPLAAISPVFKTDCLPLFMTNSTNINIQFQVQNPNVPFPLHNPMNGNYDGTTYLKKDDQIVAQIPTLSGSGVLTSTDKIMVFDIGPKWWEHMTPDEIASFQSILSHRWTTTGKDLEANDPPSARVGLCPGAVDAQNIRDLYKGTLISFYQNGMSANLSVTGGENFADGFGSGWLIAPNTKSFTSKTVKPIGGMNYLFWAPEFSIKAYIKTYAAAYGNPLVSRYLRPYLVGPEKQPSFFRSAFLSYNFNAMTYTVPAGSTIPFNFNISQTLLNVPMAFIMFSEISYSLTRYSNEVIPSSSKIYGGGYVGECLFGTQNGYFGGENDANGFMSDELDVNPAQLWNSLAPAVTRPANDAGVGHPAVLTETYYYGLMDVLHRSQYFISRELQISGVQCSIGPSGWNLYQRPLDVRAMNAVTLNTLTRYDSEMVWKQRVANPQRFYMGDAWAAFDLSHDEFRGLFIDADNMLNVTGNLTNTSTEAKTVYIQLILPYVDHFVINLADSTVTKSQV